MKIRPCPGCAQLVHFEESFPIEKCWNCGLTTDFSHLKTPEERLFLWIGSLFDRTLPDCSGLVGVGRVALVIAVPIAVMMLLICNSFNIRIVPDPTVPFWIP
jgi:hypothetical protein